MTLPGQSGDRRASRLLAALALGMVCAMQVPAQQAAANDMQAAALARAQGLLRQIGQQKQQLEVDNAHLKAELANVSSQLRKAGNAADARNLEPFRINDDILALAGRQGGWAALLAREPLTGLLDVAAENELQDYRRRLFDALLDGHLDVAVPPLPAATPTAKAP